MCLTPWILTYLMKFLLRLVRIGPVYQTVQFEVYPTPVRAVIPEIAPNCTKCADAKVSPKKTATSALAL